MLVSGKSLLAAVPELADICKHGLAVRLHGRDHLFRGASSNSHVDVERSEQVGGNFVASTGPLLQHHRLARHHI